MSIIYIYDGSKDKSFTTTKHTVMPISIGECKHLDMLTFRKDGRKDWSLFYCEDGTLEFEEDSISSGQVWIYPPNVPQKYTSLKENNTLYHYLHFTGSDVEEVIASLNIPVCTPLDTPDDIFFEILKKIKKATIGDDGYSRITAEYYILRLLSLLSKKNVRISHKNMMLRVTEDMAHTYPMPYDASKYAKMFSVSVSRFNHLFKEIIGTSPLKYYTKLRIENACLQIEYTDLTIGEVAKRVGYEDSVYFSQVFKKHIGISPSAYRRIYQK